MTLPQLTSSLLNLKRYIFESIYSSFFYSPPWPKTSPMFTHCRLQEQPGTWMSLLPLRLFAGNTVGWLIKVARLIFEPIGTSSLFTFTTESFKWWLDRDMEFRLWKRVTPGEQLRATIWVSPRQWQSNNAHKKKSPSYKVRDKQIIEILGYYVTRWITETWPDIIITHSGTVDL